MSSNAKILPSRHRITVAEYHRMGEASIFTEDDRVELIEGEIIDMAPIGARHAACVGKLTDLFYSYKPLGAQVVVQNPVHLGEDSEPHPDIALVRPRKDRYAAAHPGPQDVLLLIEVADTSANYDLSVKVPLYARYRIPEVWLVDLPGGYVEVFLEPGPEGYGEVRKYYPGERLQPKLLSGVTIDVAEILPKEA